jgi:ferrous iron transport protein B
MTVIVFLAPIFFGGAAMFVAWGLVITTLAVLALVGVLINRWVLKGERDAFIMELPLYHRPNLQSIGIQVWQNSAEFLKKAGTLIVVMSIVVWALSVLPHGDIETSYLGSIGRALVPLGALMGLDWRMIVALLTSFVAKENAIATMGVLFGSAGGGAPGMGGIGLPGTGREGGLGAALAGVLSPAAALAFLVVQMLFVPCVATVAAIRQETKSWGWTGLSVGLLLALSLAAGIGVYQVANGWLV